MVFVKILQIVFIIVGLIFLLSILYIFLQNKKPQIDLGLVNGRLREIPNKKNAVSTETKFKDKLVSPLKLNGDIKEAKEAMKTAFESYGGIEIIKETDNYIYAVSTTKVLKFHDDVELFFDIENRKIHYRSASRAGNSDMGLNRERYNMIVSLYHQFSKKN